MMDELKDSPNGSAKLTSCVAAAAGIKGVKWHPKVLQELCAIFTMYEFCNNLNEPGSIYKAVGAASWINPDFDDDEEIVEDRPSPR